MTPLWSHLLLVTFSIGTARCTLLPVLFNVLGAEVKPQDLLQTTNEVISLGFNANQATKSLPQRKPYIKDNVPSAVSDWDLLNTEMPDFYKQIPPRNLKYVSSFRSVHETVSVPRGYYYLKPGVQRVPMPAQNYLIRIQSPPPLPVPVAAPEPVPVPAAAPAPGPSDIATDSSPLTLSMGHNSVTR